MSKLGMMTTVIATELCEAVTKDEQGEGLDISAGMFGTATSEWVRGLAQLIADKDEQIAALTAQFADDKT